VGNRPINFTDPLGLQEAFPLDPGIPPPQIPLPDAIGCFGAGTFFNLAWISSEPSRTFVGLNGFTAGGGIIFCYKIKCDACPSGGQKGDPTFGLTTIINRFRLGVGIGVTKNSLCVALGPFYSFTPGAVSIPIEDF